MQENLINFPIHPSQHGFCSDKSTLSAIANNTTFLADNTRSKNKHVILISLDIQAAFDTATPDSIKHALLKHGSCPLYADWYHNYLTHRNLTTELKGETYNATTAMGFPQGGVVSADFWKILFDPALEIINSNDTTGTGYADDLVLLKSGYKLSHTLETVQKTLNKLIKWGESCGLTFNPQKTIVLYFCKDKTPPSQELKMQGKLIPYSHTVRYLGVTIDDKLTWKPHREKALQQAKQSLVTLNNKIATLYGPNPQLSKWLYTGVIRPKLEYASMVWTHSINTKKIRQQFDKINSLACSIITPTRKSISPRSLEVIYDMLPLPLHLESTAISAFVRLANVLTPPTKNSKQHYFTHIQNRINDLQIIIPDIDKANKLNLQSKYQINENTFGPEYSKHLTHSQLNIYTDGSKTKTGTGAGFVIFDKQKLIHKDFIPLSPTSTIFQAEVIAIGAAAKFINKMSKTLKPTYVKFFSDSRAALQALNNHKIKSSVVDNTVTHLNILGTQTKRTTLNWIKAHNNHKGNEYADEMANLAASCDQEHKIVPISQKLFKDHIKTAIYAEWIKLWKQDTGIYKHTRLFFPIMDPKYSQKLLKLSRSDLKQLIEVITGHNYLRQYSNKISTLPNVQCRFCDTQPETFLHLFTDCPKFTLDRYQLKILKYPLLTTENNTPNWSITQLLEFCNLPEIHTALNTINLQPN